MVELLFNNVNVLFWSSIIFFRLLNHKISGKTILAEIIFVFISAYTAASMRFLPSVIRTVVALLFLCVFHKFAANVKWNKSIFHSVIACAIGQSFYILSNVVSALVFAVLIAFDLMSLEDVLYINLFIFRFCANLLFTFSLFRIRKFKKGFMSLDKVNITGIGFPISLIALSYFTVYNNSIQQEEIDRSFYLSIILIPVFLIITLIWWYSGLTKSYKNYLYNQALFEIKDELNKKKEYISELLKEVYDLSKIIHEDNKLIPSIILLLKESIDETEFGTEAGEGGGSEKKMQLLKQIQSIADERTAEIYNYDGEVGVLPKTYIDTLDVMLRFLAQKASANGAEFNINIIGNIKPLAEKHIRPEKLRALIADLVENAINAVKTCPVKNILLTLSESNGMFLVAVEDSGVDFKKEVLRDLGKKAVTTRQDEGGKGIGYMAIFDILKETDASINIEKYSLKTKKFTKKILVNFGTKLQPMPVNAVCRIVTSQNL